MVCSFCGILRTVSTHLKRFFFACVVTWELLGNLHSEELGCRQSVQSVGVQSFHWLERLKLCGCCGKFRHKCGHVEPIPDTGETGYIVQCGQGLS